MCRLSLPKEVGVEYFRHPPVSTVTCIRIYADMLLRFCSVDATVALFEPALPRGESGSTNLPEGVIHNFTSTVKDPKKVLVRDRRPLLRAPLSLLP